jgi:hypothetical protein
MGTQMYVQKDTKNDHGVVPALRGFGMASPAEQSMVLHDQIYCSTTCTCRDAFLQREGGGGAHHRNFMALFRNRSAVRMLGGERESSAAVRVLYSNTQHLFIPSAILSQ